jgi:arylsulfatase A-like enzyme
VRFRAVPIPASLLFAAAVVTAFIPMFEAHSGATFHAHSRALSLLRDLATYVPYLAPVVLIELSLAKSRVLRAIALGAYFSVHAIVDGAFVAARGNLDYAFVRDNLAEATSPAGATMVYGAIPKGVWLLLAIELLVLAIVIWRSAPGVLPLRGRARLGAIAVCMGVIAAAVASILPSRDALGHFTASCMQYYGANARMRDARARTPDPYPLVHEAGLSPKIVPLEKKPNIVLVLMESFSARYLDQLAADGAPYTPVMNAHAKAGLSVEHFYGNSVQTCHGHFATLCSLAPSYRKKESYIGPLDLMCLPHVLAREGYVTARYDAIDDDTFDGATEFARRVGFQESMTVTGRLTPEERNHVWGWGLQDDLFYAWALRKVAALSKAQQKPFFATLAPVSNHYPFQDEPGRASIAGEATPSRADYAASLRASDARLARLFEVLEELSLEDDTLVILTGDHSFPADEHGSHWNERGFYEESFRVPFVMQWKGHIAPTRITAGAFSQIDIAPTVLDVLRVKTRVPWEGRSILDTEQKAPRFVPLVQPYDGQYLGAVVWPWKYREHGLSGERRVFDLEHDPNEESPLSPTEAPPEVRERLVSDVERIHLNQALLLSNEVWAND